MRGADTPSDSPVPATLPAPDPPDAALPSLDGAELATARRYATASRAAGTQRAYASDWRRFSAWCFLRGLQTLPADPRVVAVFLSAEAHGVPGSVPGAAPPTVGRRLAAIGWMHRRAGLQPPQAREGAAAILEVMAGIRRSHGIAPTKKHAADAEILGDLLRGIAGTDLRSVRDRALLAFGMAGAFRRSELVALTLADLERVPEGLRVTIRRGKTDQEGAGAVIAIPEGRRLRPKALLEAWLDQAGITDGFLFRRLSGGSAAGSGVVTACPMSDRAVARLVQARAAAAGYAGENFAGHSLRAGFLTAAARSGASVFKMREVSRHKSMQVLADYVRDAELFRDHAGEGFL
jgi:integrase